MASNGATDKPYRSGRTVDQGIRVCVLEGDTLYVSPKRFSMMKLATDAGIDTLHGPARSETPILDPDRAAEIALRVAGLLQAEIELRKFRETRIVVDYELRD